jgi:hypothetical protein
MTAQFDAGRFEIAYQFCVDEVLIIGWSGKRLGLADGGFGALGSVDSSGMTGLPRSSCQISAPGLCSSLRIQGSGWLIT